MRKKADTLILFRSMSRFCCQYLLILAAALLWVSATASTTSTDLDDRGNSLLKSEGVMSIMSITSAAGPAGTPFFDDGMAIDNYDDDAEADTLIICPTDPKAEVVRIVFTAFDVAAGDTYVVYDADTSGLATATTYTGSGTGVPNSPGGGWVQADCDNMSGCLTIIFTPNGDGIKGAGWEAAAITELRDFTYECPEDATVSGDCMGDNGQYTVPAIDLECDSMPAPDFYFVVASFMGEFYPANGFNTIPVGAGGVITYHVFKSDVVGGMDVNGDGLLDMEVMGMVPVCMQTITVNAATLACNDNINVVLDFQACEVLVTYDMVLENPCSMDPSAYTIIVEDADLPPSTVASPGTYNYSITHDATGYSCWGTITVEDKTAPYCINELDSVWVPCSMIDSAFEDVTLDSIENYFFDCSEIVDVYYDDTDSEDCLLDEWTDPGTMITYQVVRRITRNWYAVDEHGNVTIPDSTCVQVVNVIRPLAGGLDPLTDVTLSCGQNADPDDPDNDLTADHLPSFGFDKDRDGVIDEDEHFTLNHDDCKYALLWTDTEDVDLCGDGVKFLRTWTLVDWCTNVSTPLTPSQIIAIKDTLPPVFDNCPEDDDEGGINNPHLFDTDLFECTTTPAVPAPSASDDCSGEPEVTMISVYKKIGADFVLQAENLQLTGPLDIGEYYSEFHAIDDCDNVSDTCKVYYNIEDNIRPSAVCDDELQVSIGNATARVYAEFVDEGSSDNCGVELLQVRRSEDDPWADHVDFECDDVATEVKVYLGVWDESGNFNECWVTFIPEDKIDPICNDLEDEELYCDEIHNDELGEDTNGLWENDQAIIDIYNERFGDPIENAFDNCEVVSMDQEYRIEAWPCGEVLIERRFRAVDASGNTSSYCYQNIEVKYRADWSVTFPEDWEGVCGEAFPDASIDIENGSCDLLGWEHEDLIFDIVDDACYKILRTYYVINWCRFDEGDINDPNVISRLEVGPHGHATAQTISSAVYGEDGYFAYTQILKVHDDTEPIITIADVETCIYGVGDVAPFNTEDVTPGGPAFECDTVRTFSATGVDCNEAATAALEFSWEMIINGDVVGSGDGASFSWTVEPKVSYEVRFRAEDNCGNSAWEGRTFEFWDCKKPTPYCLNGVTAELMPNVSTISVWANDLDHESYDNCTSQDNLQFRIWHESIEGQFAEPTNNDDAATILALPQAIEFNCIWLGSQTVNIYIIDEEGNWDFCSTYVLVQDNGGSCGPGDMMLLTGTISTDANEAIENVEIHLTGDSEMPATQMTNQDGSYQYNLAEHNDYVIQPIRDDNHVDGVSTIDLVIMTQHILGITPFTTATQWIAADVNNNGTVSSFDIVQSRQLILGLIDRYPSNTSWRFVEEGYQFTASNPLTEEFPEAHDLRDLSSNVEVNFKGIKIGDVNSSLLENATSTEDRSAGDFILQTQDIAVEAGQTYTVNFTADELTTIKGYQFTLQYNANNLEFTKLQEGIASEEHFGLNRLDQGIITTSWNGTAEKGNLFGLTFTANTSGQLSDMISVTSKVTAAQAYNTDAKSLDVQLNFQATSTAITETILYQNTPNPFSAQTQIAFHLPEAQTATIRVTDISGRVLKQYTNDFAKGHNNITINSNELPASGILYYQLETNSATVVKKMVLVK